MTKKNHFFGGWSSFKFNNLGLALDMTLQFFTIVAKGLKLKARKFCGLGTLFVEVTGEKLVEEGRGGVVGLFAPISWIGLMTRFVSQHMYACSILLNKASLILWKISISSIDIPCMACFALSFHRRPESLGGNKTKTNDKWSRK